MELVNRASAEWDQLKERSAELIIRAAQCQAFQARIPDLGSEASRLWSLYEGDSKKADWREFGDLAFHLCASYPPDLAHAILYGFRAVRSPGGCDPVPFTMKALENLFYLRPAALTLRLEASPEVARLVRDPLDRAQRAMRILVREISGSPYSAATGIYAQMDSQTRSIFLAALTQFNPNGAKIIAKGSRAWMRTPTGLLRLIWRLIFGNE
jgi:hypothetical protein